MRRPFISLARLFCVACCCCCYYGDGFLGWCGGVPLFPPFARVLPGLFNSAHPIIRDRESTSSRPLFLFFFFFASAVARHRSQSTRTDRGGTHRLSCCCYVLRLLGGGGGEESRPGAALASCKRLAGNVWRAAKRRGADPVVGRREGWYGGGAPWGPLGRGVGDYGVGGVIMM